MTTNKERRKADYLPICFGALIFDDGNHNVAWERKSKGKYKVGCSCDQYCRFVRLVSKELKKRYDKQSVEVPQKRKFNKE